MNLINKRLLNQKIQSFEFPTGEKLVNAKRLLEGWQKALKDSDLDKTKEKSVQGKFLTTFFENILGYTDVTTGQDEWTLIQHPRIENDAMEPDGSLGWFTKDQKITRAVIELKDARTALDKKQSSRAGKLTPIEQAYLYATKYDGCNWIIVSNFKEVRLYNKHRTQEYFEKFEVLDLTSEQEFKRFYFLLNKKNLISKNEESILDDLVKNTTQVEQDITKKFYAEYKQIRLSLLGHLIQNNSEIQKEILLEKTQKLLDRFIFTLFCEDTSSLLPLNIVKDTYDRALRSFSASEERVWNEFKGLFLSIDKGNTRVKPPINAYNGGLFALDDELDSLKIKDDFWSDLMHLTTYDFETDLNVNILGHIFEQSISDLESLKSELKGENQDKNKSKRKKDGIYYTPEHITKYIVENSIGKYLEENPDRLSAMKILDPACGSGAFLNQAHSYLSNEYKTRHETLIEEKVNKGESISLFDYNPAVNDKAVLLNNLFGVDLNSESVEITKLALWLKTARTTEPLQNLDKNIKTGNSLIDDPAIANQRAFNWSKEFEEVMSNGGFDVIIGNPPYGVSFENEEKVYLKQLHPNVPNFEIYIYFISKGLSLLKDGGILGFIFPNTFLSTLFGKKYREWILNNFEILEISNLSDDQTFEDASVRTCICFFRKLKKEKYEAIVSYYDKKVQNFKTIQKLDKSFLINHINNWLDLFDYSPKNESLIKKIQRQIRINDICEVSQGLIPYDKYRGHDEATIKNRIWHSNFKKDETYKPELQGADIERYILEWNGKTFISYGPWLAAPRNPKFFTSPRVLIREIVNKNLNCAYTDDEFYNTPSIINIIQKDPQYSLFFILAVLNSSLLGWYHHQTSPKANKGLFPKILINDVRNLPIPKSTVEHQATLADKARTILRLNKELFDKKQKALELLSAKYSPKSISTPLKSFYTLGWNELIAELEKQKVKVSLSNQEELQQWFDNKKSDLLDLANKVKLLDKEIDQEVFRLYGLTDEEIKTIEASLDI